MSIVVPVLDEARALPETIGRLCALDPRPADVMFVDGGSTDGSRDLLTRETDGSWMRTSDAPRGRGAQLNAGARAAGGDALLFAHADAWLPADVVTRVRAALDDDCVVGGAFTIAFAPADGSPASMPLIAVGINARARVTRTATGDQAIFVRRDVFEALEGFRNWPLFEDVDLVARLKRRGRFVILAGPVVVSDRRYAQHGPWRTTILMWLLRIRYWLGESPDSLKRSFADVRASGERG